MFSSLSFLMHIKHIIDIDVFFVNDVTGHLKMVVLQRLELFSVHPVGEYFGFNHKNMQFQALQFWRAQTAQSGLLEILRCDQNGPKNPLVKKEL